MIGQIKILLMKTFCDIIQCHRKRGMKIGNDCSLNTWNFYSECYLIEIGDHVQITSGVNIFTHGGGWVMRNISPDYDSFAKVIIGNNVYIGNNSMIMPGITVGNNVIIAAGSIITKNVPDNVVVAGNPAKIVKSMGLYVEKYLKYDLHCKNMTSNEKRSFLQNLPVDKLFKVSTSL